MEQSFHVFRQYLNGRLEFVGSTQTIESSRQLVRSKGSGPTERFAITISWRTKSPISVQTRRSMKPAHRTEPIRHGKFLNQGGRRSSELSASVVPRSAWDCVAMVDFVQKTVGKVMSGCIEPQRMRTASALPVRIDSSL